MTPAEWATRVQAAMPDLVVEIDWASGNMGKLNLTSRSTGRNAGWLIVDRGRCKVPREVREGYAHGLERSRSHPEYPKPHRSPFIEKLLTICGEPSAQLNFGMFA